MSEGSGIPVHCRKCGYDTVYFPESPGEQAAVEEGARGPLPDCPECGPGKPWRNDPPTLVASEVSGHA